MAQPATTQLNVLVNTPGVEKLPRLAASLRRLTVSTKKAGLSFNELSAGLKKQQVEGGKSINNTRTLANAWKELAASVEFGSKQFVIATGRAQKLNAQLNKMEGGRRIGLKGIAKTAGAVAAAGVFGGPEGAIGAGIGAAVGGGPLGAAAGGAIGAQVGMMRQAIGEVAEYDAALELQRKALRLVIKDTGDYNKAQKFLTATSRDLAIPQDVIVRQFTSLTASVIGAGGSLEDAKDAFKGVASGIRGTGGSLEDMKAAMTATSQVFSKGKVSAEELRQQLGERLPGAFTLFAESMGKTPAELDKALEGGKVTLQDFMTFTTTLTDRYFENAKKLADGPEAAGDRLKTSMSELKDALGDILRPIGASFQSIFADIAKAIAWATREINKLLLLGEENAIAKLERQIKIRERRVATWDKRQSSKDELENLKEQLKILKAVREEQGEVGKSLRDVDGQGETTYNGLTGGAKKYLQSIKSVSEEMADAFENGFKKMEDQLVNFVTTGTFEFKKFAQSVLSDLTRIYIRQAMVQSFSMFGIRTNAKGNVYAQNGIVPFAKGGIVNSPILFKFANGVGLMGEAGPEAIMPLRRGPGGRLGVESSGGGTNVVVNVDASGSSVEGDAQSARQLGSAISVAVQQELVRQRRPGGLLV